MIRRATAQRFRSTTEFTAAEPAVYPNIEILQSPRKSSAVSVGSTHFVKLSFLAKAASLAVYPDISRSMSK